LSIKEDDESCDSASVLLYIVDRLAEGCSCSDDIIEEDTLLSCNLHPESIAALAMILDFLAMRRESYILTGSCVVLSCHDSRERDSLVCWTVEDICRYTTVTIRKIQKQGISVYLRDLRESLAMLHEVPSVEEPRRRTPRLGDKRCLEIKEKHIVLCTILYEGSFCWSKHSELCVILEDFEFSLCIFYA
jgi:hypothetical protein